eukprot:sb/3468437/
MFAKIIKFPCLNPYFVWGPFEIKGRPLFLVPTLCPSLTNFPDPPPLPASPFRISSPSVWRRHTITPFDSQFAQMGSAAPDNTISNRYYLSVYANALTTDALTTVLPRSAKRELGQANALTQHIPTLDTIVIYIITALTVSSYDLNMSKLTSSCTAHYVPFSNPAGDRTVWLLACDKSYYYHGKGGVFTVWRRRPHLTALRIKWGMALPYSVFIFSIQKSNKGFEKETIRSVTLSVASTHINNLFLDLGPIEKRLKTQYCF